MTTLWISPIKDYSLSIRPAINEGQLYCHNFLQKKQMWQRSPVSEKVTGLEILQFCLLWSHLLRFQVNGTLLLSIFRCVWSDQNWLFIKAQKKNLLYTFKYSCYWQAWWWEHYDTRAIPPQVKRLFLFFSQQDGNIIKILIAFIGFKIKGIQVTPSDPRSQSYRESEEQIKVNVHAQKPHNLYEVEQSAWKNGLGFLQRHVPF